MVSVDPDKCIPITVGKESFLIKPPPPSHLREAADVSSPAEEDLDAFLQYFYGGSLPSSLQSKFSKIRVRNRIVVYYDMGMEFGDFEKPTGELECLLHNWTPRKSQAVNVTMPSVGTSLKSALAKVKF